MSWKGCVGTKITVNTFCFLMELFLNFLLTHELYFVFNKKNYSFIFFAIFDTKEVAPCET